MVVLYSAPKRRRGHECCTVFCAKENNQTSQTHKDRNTHTHTARFQFTHSYLFFTFIPAFKNSYFSATSDSIKLLFRHCFKTFARCEATGLDGKKLSSTRIRRIDQENASLQMHNFRSSQNLPSSEQACSIA